MTGDIRALTVQQPWAHAIAHLDKRTENRTRPLRRGIETLFIHAGKAPLDPRAAEPFFHRRIRLPEDLAYGAIVAVTSIVGCCGAGFPGARGGCDCDSWAADGQWHWQLGDVTPLREPVPCKGALGLWKPTPDVIDAVLAQLRVAVSS